MGDSEKSVINTLISIDNANRTANSELGITQEYNRSLYDTQKEKNKRKAYKKEVFGEKKTYKDPISGKIIHSSQEAAQNRYHMKNADGKNVSSKWAQHATDVDHINALKDMHDKVKNNPFLTDEDFKGIMNSDENFRVLSKSVNASKGEKSDWEVILDKDSAISNSGKLQMAKEKINSDIFINSQFAARTIENAKNEFIIGATDTLIDATIPLTVEAVRKMVEVAQGKESLGDCAKDMSKIAVEVGVSGGTNKLLVDIVTSQFTNSKNSVLQNIANNNEVAQIIAVVAIVQESALKYVNGEIDGNEFIEQVGQKGATMVAGMIGGQVGREIGGIIGGFVGTIAMPGGGTAVGVIAGQVIGEILGVIITTVSCSAIVSIFNTTKHMNDYKIKESQIRKLEKEALKEMENQRTKFRNIVEKEYKVWDEKIQEGFDQMLACACEQTYNLQGITEGLDKILSIFGKEVHFKTLEEYESQLDQTLKLSF